MILKALKNLIYNVFTFFANLFIWRNKKVWIIGSWMGTKFADNSRFLYDYLVANKEKYGLKRIVWITRSVKVVKEMRSLGFADVVLAGTKDSLYWHLKAGVHVICNSVGTLYPGDIDTKYSFGAKKIQLWHGVGIKACNKLCRKDRHPIKYWIADHIVNYLYKPGFWERCYFLTTSQENSRVAVADFGVKRNRIIEAQYPRNIWNPKLTVRESLFIEKLKERKQNNSVVLYLPTFKKSVESFIQPDKLIGFDSFLSNKNVIWIQKKHSADRNIDLSSFGRENVISLESDFDVNVLYQYIDLLISDYSSATTDAIAAGKMTLDYCPDFSDYESKDRGFVNEYKKYHFGKTITNPDDLFDEIEARLHCSDCDRNEYQSVRIFLLGDKEWDMDSIVKKIMKSIKVRY